MTVNHEKRDAVARKGLTRELLNERAQVQVANEGDGLTIDGLFVVFNSRTLIDSWEGSFYEESAPGSTKKSLRENMPRMQFDHGHHPLLGSLPPGVWTYAGEETGGARGIGRLSDNWLVEPFRMAIADGAVKGMSYRFGVIREEWRDQEGNLIRSEEVPRRIYSPGMSEADLLVRTLKETAISEAGPVVWPAYEETMVGVRSKVTIDLGRINSDPAQRSALAQALYVADAVERGEAPPTDPGSTQTADAPPPTGHPSEEPTIPAPDAPPPDGHPSSNPSPALRQREREIALLRARADIALKGAARNG